MGEEMEDEHFLAIVVNGGNEAEVVAVYVKNGDGFPTLNLHLVGVGEGFSGFDEVFPRGGKRESRPITQWFGGFRKALGIFTQGDSFDQPHSQDNMSIQRPLCQ